MAEVAVLGTHYLNASNLRRCWSLTILLVFRSRLEWGGCIGTDAIFVRAGRRRNHATTIINTLLARCYSLSRKTVIRKIWHKYYDYGVLNLSMTIHQNNLCHSSWVVFAHSRCCHQAVPKNRSSRAAATDHLYSGRTCCATDRARRVW